MRNGYIIDTLTSVDIKEIIRIGGKKLKYMKVLYIEKTLRYYLLKKLEKIIYFRTKIQRRR